MRVTSVDGRVRIAGQRPFKMPRREMGREGAVAGPIGEYGGGWRRKFCVGPNRAAGRGVAAARGRRNINKSAKSGWAASSGCNLRPVWTET